MEEKYIDLLLNKCVDFTSGILFIHYDKEIKNFIKKIINRAKELGIKEVYQEEFDPYYNHDYGKCIPELLQIGIQARDILFGGEDYEG